MNLNPLVLIDNIYKQTKYLMIDSNLYVIKDYASEIGLFKWHIITLSNLAVKIYPFTQDPLERMKREVTFYRAPITCICKPDLILVDYVGLRTIRGFIKGDMYDFNAPVNIHYEIGRSLGRCHEEGWVFGDTKITNYMVSQGRIYLIDAEQALMERNTRYEAWDLLVLISTLTINGYVKALTDDQQYERIIRSIFKGYLEGNVEGIEVLKSLKSGEFKLLSYLLVPFPLNYVFTQEVHEAVK